jgi:hypothetical protein
VGGWHKRSADEEEGQQMKPRVYHGQSKTLIYAVWREMHKRCRNPKNRAFGDYGGRGIYVCPEWDDFRTFAADMGERPEGLTLERIDNDGPYSPENCRWATRTDQMLNRRSTRWLTHEGRTMTMRQWEKELGLSVSGLRYRLDRGWSLERTLTTPVMK